MTTEDRVAHRGDHPGRGSAREAVRTLNPGYFALVMATGILSVATYHQRAYALSVVLLWLTGVEFIVLVGVSAIRIVAFRKAFAHDLADPGRAFGLFTFVAAADVLGTRLAIDDHYSPAFALLTIAWLTWLALGYIVPWMAGPADPDAARAATCERDLVHLGGCQPVGCRARRHPGTRTGTGA